MPPACPGHQSYQLDPLAFDEPREQTYVDEGTFCSEF